VERKGEDPVRKREDGSKVVELGDHVHPSWRPKTAGKRLTYKRGRGAKLRKGYESSTKRTNSAAKKIHGKEGKNLRASLRREGRKPKQQALKGIGQREASLSQQHAY